MPTDYLYVQLRGDQVWRLNITNLGNQDDELRRVDYSRGELPARMRCMPVGGSVLYMVGGSNRIGGQLPNLEVFNLDFDDQAIKACDWIPRMRGPKSSPMVTIIGGRIYFLDRSEDPLVQPLFEVFDPYEEMWTTLPDPPWIDFDDSNNDYPYYNFVWAQKIVFCTRKKGLFSFDTGSGTWQQYEDESQLGFPILSGTAVEFNGFLIAMPMGKQKLFAYKLDSHGNLESSWVLEELREVFDPPELHFFQGFVTRFDYDDGCPKMCLLFSSMDYVWRWSARVAIFRFYTSFDNDGNVIPSATLETLRHYDFDNEFDNDFIYFEYAFGMRR